MEVVGLSVNERGGKNKNNLANWGSKYEMRASAQVTSGVEVWNAGLECLFVCLFAVGLFLDITVDSSRGHR